MKAITAFVVLFGLGFAAGGCMSKHDPQDLTDSVSSTLHRAASCPDLEQMLKADANAKANAFIDQQIAAIRNYGNYGYGYGAPGARNAGASPPQAAGTSTSGGASGSGAAATTPAATDYSQTDVQVQGVDEADIVKNDGKFIYVLHGQAFMTVNAWPVSSLATQSSFSIEGNPIEMFVANGKAVIFSTVDGTPIYAAAGVGSRPFYQEYSGFGYATGADMAPAYRGGINVSSQMPLTKITVLGVSNGVPSLEREVYFEGNYMSSRRVDSHVRVVLVGGARGPQLKNYPSTPPQITYTSNPTPAELQQQQMAWIQAWEQLRGENLAILNQTTVADWVPYQMVRTGGAVKAQMTACEDFYMPTVGTTQYGLAQVESIDLSAPSEMPKSTAVGGGVDTVYAKGDTMYLAQRGWNESNYYVMMGGGVAVGAPVAAGSGTAGSAPGSTGTVSAKDFNFNYGIRYDVPVTMNWTHLHKFEFKTDPSFANYVASGTVVGQVVNQFSLDDLNGNLRITTTEEREWLTPPYAPNEPQPMPANTNQPTQFNHLFVLTEDNGALRLIGDVGDLAAGEHIYSTRFVGTRGYVVTFKQMDPLFVVDLSNPSQPTVLAELTIPGFSDYMEPIDANHLLTIGQDTKAGHCTGCAAPAGLDLQIFDVTDATSPKLTSKFVFGGYGTSEAQTDHKAFTYFADRQLLAFPYYGNATITTGGVTSSTMKSTLEIFHVDVNAGLTQLGSIDHTPLFGTNTNGYCGGYFNPEVRRGVFLENIAYSISYAGIIAKDVGALNQPGQTLTLPAPVMQGQCGGGGVATPIGL
jgi:hypothetical protein